MEAYICPLCKSGLKKGVYEKILGIWAERQNIEKDLKLKLEKFNQDKKIWERDKKETERQVEIKIKKKYDLEKQRDIIKAKKEGQAEAKKEALKIAEDKIKKTDKQVQYLSGLVTKQTSKITEQNNRIIELNIQLKNKTTPQLEGFENEKKILEILQGIFKKDIITPYGHAGDILHEIIQNDKKIATILYECKKTQKFDKNWIDKIKLDMKKRNADIGIIVTFAFDKKSSGYSQKEGIHIVHPYAIHHIAELLREIEIVKHNSKLSEKEKDARIQKIWEYTKSTEFGNSVKTIILTIQKDKELMEREIKFHNVLWQQRTNHHSDINENISKIKNKTIDIFKEGIEEPISIKLVNDRLKRKKRGYLLEEI